MKKIIFVLTILVVCIVSIQAFAFNSQLLRYYFPGGRTLLLVESQPKPTDTLTLGFGFNYAHQPFEFGNSAGNVRVLGIVDSLYTFDFNASYSFSDRVAISLGIPFHITRNIQSLTNVTMETPLSFGDIMLSGIYNIVPRDSNQLGIGFSAVPFVSFPTGMSGNFVGDSSLTGGLLAVGDVEYKQHYFGLNLGLRFRAQETFLNLDVASELLYTAAYHFNIMPDNDLGAFLELSGATVLKDFFQTEIQSPFDIKIGVSKGFLADYQLKVTGFGGIGIGNGYGTPDLRMGLKVTYDHLLPRTKIRIIETKIEKIEKELKELTIYYPTDGSRVDPFYDQKIKSIAKILEDNPDLGPIYLVGHTDSVGSRPYNRSLSERRAKKAAKSIISHGLNPKDIVWVGLGEDYPVVDNSSDANRALNRRTLFTYIKPEQLEEKVTRRGVVGVNTITGKKNDSYTEALKELESKKAIADPNTRAVVVKKYKDSSEVIVEGDGTTATKDSPSSSPKKAPVEPRTKKVYKSKKVKTVKTGKGKTIEETTLDEDDETFENF